MTPFETYESRLPSAQNAVDAIDGWVGRFPPEYALKAGDAALFDDPRVRFALDRFGPVAGRDVLEIGPLEAAHTRTLAEAGAIVDAIEANKKAYLRCLVAKEIMRFSANFYLGDAVKWLEETPKRYDLIFACGVLYHMPDPLRLLEAIGARTDAVCLWTHFVDVDSLPIGDARRKDWNATLETQRFRGADIRLYRRSYVRANEHATFCGGIFDEHRWMDRNGLLKALAALGMTEIVVDGENHTDSPHGPFLSVFARRP
ncbi:bifunctional 2-polyprenyl-6-hydroxyphenol methylase/3-demethylubiquinol 3-O-methyltransferase UbiG [Methylocapsa sp. S129]|uniref:class I SAM-dependent methyltransferase n=1 Tax=Methylocapsa sp. S129 TaxID=1641869 RepID=UPI00131AF305|nr:class I SAM-dependent methyltransferase [Methylocapsa sp. S129]